MKFIATQKSSNESPSKVSIIIPCYNQAQYLPDAVESVVNQTYKDWECIIVNDGSPDNTSKAARKLMAKYHDRRIIFLEKENGGLADARNFGIKNSHGKYILPLDADDKIHPEILQKTVTLLETHPEVAIAYTDPLHFGKVNGPGRLTEWDFNVLLYYNPLLYCSLYRREVWESVGGYNAKLVRGYVDWDFWIACGEKGFQGKRIPEPLFTHRVKDSSMLTNAVEHAADLKAQIVLNHPTLYGDKVREWAQAVMNSEPWALAIGHSQIIPADRELSRDGQAEVSDTSVPPDVRKKFEDVYASVLRTLTDISLSEARIAIGDMLGQVYKEAHEEGTDSLPPNCGDLFLEKESSDKKIGAMLKKKRTQGVSDDDIRNWWNIHDIERRMILKIDDAFKDAQFFKFTKQYGLNEDDAMKAIRKNFPIFGDPYDKTDASRNDRPLPYELMNRVNSYIKKMSQIDSEKYQKTVEASSTLNAFIRKELKKGQL